jgi:HIV Tat-specific factor 1
MKLHLTIFFRTNKPKIKVYRDENGVPKGDALCTYVKVESVDLALTIIDGSTEHSKVIKIKIERVSIPSKHNERSLFFRLFEKL